MLKVWIAWYNQMEHCAIILAEDKDEAAQLMEDLEPELIQPLADPSRGKARIVHSSD